MSIIDYAVQKSAHTAGSNFDTHIIYAGNYYHHDFIAPQMLDTYLNNFIQNKDKLRHRVLRSIKKHNLKSALVTSLLMKRFDFITKEKMDNIHLGTENWFHTAKESVNDDLDGFLESLQSGRELKSKAWTHFLPKLTNKEQEKFENKDEDFFGTCLFSVIKDTNNDDCELTDSDSMYVEGFCLRHTIRLENPTIPDLSRNTTSKPYAFIRPLYDRIFRCNNI